MCVSNIIACSYQRARELNPLPVTDKSGRTNSVIAVAANPNLYAADVTGGKIRKFW